MKKSIAGYLCILFIFISLLSGCKNINQTANFEDAPTKLNTDMIAYVNGSDNLKPYIIQTDGGNRKKLDDARTGQLFEYNNWIYYTVDDELNQGIYRVWPDGNHMTKINNDTVSYSATFQDSLYYRNGEGDLKKLNFNSLETTAISTNLSERYIKVSNQWIWFMDEGQLSRMSLDGSVVEKKLIPDYSIEYFRIHDEHLYFVASGSGSLYKANINGSDIVRLDPDIAEYNGMPIPDLNFGKEYIFYLKWSQKTLDLCRVRYDGTDFTVLYKDFPTNGFYLGSDDDTIFYTIWDEIDGKNGLYKVTLNENNNTVKLCNDEIADVIFINQSN